MKHRSGRGPAFACSARCRHSPPARYKSSIGAPFLYPRTKLGYVENYLRLSFGTPRKEYEIRPGRRARVRGLLFILHADPEQNASTSTVRLVGSAKRQHLRVRSARASTPLRVRCTAAPTRPRCWRCCVRSRRRPEHQGLCWPGQDRKSSVKLVGWPSRLQELRSAREDHQGSRRRAAA
ncbi:citrate/2-methylcitrate synthase [Tessaracoccus sp.]|uniref:citrate/2-methylcitrate synthase n=1 Tax=Tessaracoccus sp. TaxID=1971211 RepID=UPI00344F3BF6